MRGCSTAEMREPGQSASAPGTLAELLGEHDPSLPALRTVEGHAMSYGRLLEVVDVAREALNSRGIGRGDSVAIVLNNGAHMAATFVGIASAATAAPLHPGLSEREFRDSLESLRAKALVIESGIRTSAPNAADELGIPVLELVRADTDGGFRLGGSGIGGARTPSFAEPDDIALLLHTSGTTARPKLVPLTHANLATSARNIAGTLRLAPGDTCLNVMPLFHIHGLVGVLLASLCAGAAVAAAPGFQALRFSLWLRDLRPTWYSAVPTMHQAILQRSKRNDREAAQGELRLIRSSSAALPPTVLTQLEDTFQCRVVESYGMTEASHQMTSNPLGPGARKPGSVGLPAGPEVAVMTESGRFLPQGERGEVVVRGPSITGGYVDNPEANAKSFTDGWFRTGDQGFCDMDGYYSITGRLKELINRGGEKISPREVDEVLLEHEGVAQAVAFAMPHAKLGEEVAAAIVLREGATVTQQALRGFVSERLAGYKVPRRIVFLDEIPKGPSGKAKRVGLAKALGIS